MVYLVVLETIKFFLLCLKINVYLSCRNAIKHIKSVEIDSQKFLVK